MSVTKVHASAVTEKMSKKPMALLYPEAIDRVRSGKCAFHKCDNTITEFKDKESLIEFGISGLCQECQDKTFGE